MNSPSDTSAEGEAASPRATVRDGSSVNDRLVYVMVPEALGARIGGAVSLLELWSILWRRKWMLIGISVLFAAVAVPFALYQENWYRAEALLAPSKAQYSDSLTRQFGGLASLAGVSLGGNSDTAEALATLRSRNFIESFIRENDLLQVLFAEQWDSEAGTWQVVDGEEGSEPDMRDAVKMFLGDVLTVAEDARTGLVSLAVAWTDPVVAAQWADALVVRLNDQLRMRALADADRNIAFLRSELASTDVVTLQQSVGRLLENEVQKKMLARGNDEFVFRTVDKAGVPKQRFKPNRSLIVVAATVLGGLLAAIGVLMAHVILLGRNRLQQAGDL